MPTSKRQSRRTSGWEYVREHDAWIKEVVFEAVPGRRQHKVGVAVRRERKGSKIWRADLHSMMGWEALTPTHYTTVTDAKREIDHILAAYSRVRHDPHNDEDIQAVAYFVVKHSGSDRDPAFSETGSAYRSIKIWFGRGDAVDSIWHNKDETVAIAGPSFHNPPRFVIFTRTGKGMQFLHAADATTLAGAKKKAAKLSF